MASMVHILQRIQDAILRRSDFVTYECGGRRRDSGRKPVAVHHRKRLFCGRRDIITAPPTHIDLENPANSDGIFEG